MQQRQPIESIIADYLADCYTRYTGSGTRQRRPLVAGLNGPQGVGKSTICSKLPQLMLSKFQLRLAILSLDDFYLTRRQQNTIEHLNPTNSLLQGRGLPGTHDMPLAKHYLRLLTSADDAPSALRIPSYDKSAYGGLGDRVHDCDKWPSIQLPVDLVLIEGWMVGFRPVSHAVLSDNRPNCGDSGSSGISSDMKTINEYLSRDYQKGWHDEVEVLICLRPLHLTDNIYRWRREQEDELRRRLNDSTAGQSNEQLQRFIDRFIPCYNLYLDGLYGAAAAAAAADDDDCDDCDDCGGNKLLKSRLILTVDSSRRPVDSQTFHRARSAKR